MMLKLNISEQALKAIQRGVERGDSIAEMEALGLPQRTINALEESVYEIITLEQLLKMNSEQLSKITNVGDVALKQIFKCLAKYEVLEKIITEELII